MFVSLKSIKGGKPVSDIMFRKCRPTLSIITEKRAAVIEDYYCWKIGYDGEGNQMYIKPSDALALYKFLKKEFKGA